MVGRKSKKGEGRQGKNKKKWEGVESKKNTKETKMWRIGQTALVGKNVLSIGKEKRRRRKRERGEGGSVVRYVYVWVYASGLSNEKLAVF